MTNQIEAVATPTAIDEQIKALETQKAELLAKQEKDAAEAKDAAQKAKWLAEKEATKVKAEALGNKWTNIYKNLAVEITHQAKTNYKKDFTCEVETKLIENTYSFRSATILKINGNIASIYHRERFASSGSKWRTGPCIGIDLEIGTTRFQDRKNGGYRFADMARMLIEKIVKSEAEEKRNNAYQTNYVIVESWKKANPELAVYGRNENRIQASHNADKPFVLSGKMHITATQEEMERICKLLNDNGLKVEYA